MCTHIHIPALLWQGQRMRMAVGLPPSSPSRIRSDRPLWRRIVFFILLARSDHFRPARAAIDRVQDILHAGWGQMGQHISGIDYWLEWGWVCQEDRGWCFGRKRRSCTSCVPAGEPADSSFGEAGDWIKEKEKTKPRPAEIRVKFISTEEVNSCHSSVSKSGLLVGITKGHRLINARKQKDERCKSCWVRGEHRCHQ